MEKLVILTVFLLYAIQPCKAQNMTMPMTNMTVTPSQIMNFSLVLPGGGRLLQAFNWLKLLGHKHQNNDDDSFLGRCLGAARKLKFIMPFIIFKLGVIVTTLGFLTLFALKGLAIGVLLLIMNAGGLIGKAALLKYTLLSNKHKYDDHEGYSSSKDWYPPISQPTPAVHVHVHKDHDGDYKLMNNPFSSSGHTYEYGPTAWSERISKGLSESKTLAEKLELINLYKRLGFDVNAAIKQPPTGVNYVFPRKINR